MKQTLLDFMRCRAVTRKGKRCSFKVKATKYVCGLHLKSHGHLKDPRPIPSESPKQMSKTEAV